MKVGDEFARLRLLICLCIKELCSTKLNSETVTGINKYSEIGIVSAVEMESGIQ